MTWRSASTTVLRPAAWLACVVLLLGSAAAQEAGSQEERASCSSMASRPRKRASPDSKVRYIRRSDTLAWLGPVGKFVEAELRETLKDQSGLVQGASARRGAVEDQQDPRQRAAAGPARSAQG